MGSSTEVWCPPVPAELLQGSPARYETLQQHRLGEPAPANPRLGVQFHTEMAASTGAYGPGPGMGPPKAFLEMNLYS